MTLVAERMKGVRRTVVRDVFTGKSEVEVLALRPGATAWEYVPEELRGEELHLVHDGKALTRAEAEVFHVERPGGLTVLVIPQGKYGQAAFNWVAGAAIAAIGLITGAAFLIPVGISMMAQAVTSAAAIALSPKVHPQHLPSIEDTLQGSPAYSIAGFSNGLAVGAVIPVVDGKTRVAGQVLQQFFRVTSDGISELHTLYCLGHGPVYSVGGKTAGTDYITGSGLGADILINDQPATAYAGVTAFVRLGDWNQNAIPLFTETVTAQANGATLAPATPQTMTTSTPVGAFEVLISHPSGLFAVNGTGATINKSVSFTIRWREAGGPTYVFNQTKTVTAANKAPFATMVRVDKPLGTTTAGATIEKMLDIQVERTTVADGVTEVSTIAWTGINEITKVALAYPGLALLGITTPSLGQLAASIPTVTAIVEGRIPWVWDGISTTAPTFERKYVDSATNKNNLAGTVLGWTGLRTAVGPPITNERISFQFVLTKSAKVSLITERLRRSPNATSALTGTLNVKIESDSAGVPSGSVIATSVDVDIADVPISVASTSIGGDVYFGFATPPTLTVGVIYHAVLYGSYTASATEHVQLATQDATILVAPFNVGDFESMTNTYTNDTTKSVIGKLQMTGDRPGENPAWCLFNLLTDKHYGLGAWVDVNDIDLQSFKDWADFCDEGYDTNGGVLAGYRWAIGWVIDVQGGAWDAAQHLAMLGRASIAKLGRKITILIDRPASASQVFSTGNVTEFEYDWVSPEDRPNRVEVQYADRALNYSPAMIVREDSDATGDQFRTRSINAFGLTEEWRAQRLAQYIVNVAKTIKRGIQFTSQVNAVAVRPGDVIISSHDIQANAWGGRVSVDTAGGGTRINLDREDFGAGVGYQVVVTTKSTGADVIQTRTIDAQTATRQYSVTVAFNGGDFPKVNDEFLVSYSATYARYWKVASVSLRQDLSVRVVAIKHDNSGSVYDDRPRDPDGDPALIQTFTSGAIQSVTLPDPVTDLFLNERWWRYGDGGLWGGFELSFRKPRRFARAEIWFRESGSDAWRYHGGTVDGVYVIDHTVQKATPYDFRVVSVNEAGVRSSLDIAPGVSGSFAGPTKAADIPTSFAATEILTGVAFSWLESGNGTSDLNAITRDAQHAGTVAGYQIREGPIWSSARIVISLCTGNRFFAPLRSPSATTYWIASVTRAGIMSRPLSTVLVQSMTLTAERQAGHGDDSSSWPGSAGSFTLNDENDLDQSTGGSPGGSFLSSYTMVEVAGAASGVGRAIHRLDVTVDCGPFDAKGETWDQSTYTWDSDEAQYRAWNGWTQTPYDATDAQVTWDEADWAWDSVWSMWHRWDGPVDITNDAEWFLEERHSIDDGANYSAFAAFDGQRLIDCDHVKVRVWCRGGSNTADSAPVHRMSLRAISASLVRVPKLATGYALTDAGGIVFVPFGFEFPSLDYVGITLSLDSGLSGDNAFTFGATTTGFYLYCLNSANAFIARIVSWIAAQG